MAGSADITGRQNYVMGIGHPKSTPSTESPPVTVQTNPLNGGVVGLAGPNQKIDISRKPSNLVTRMVGGALTATAGTPSGNTWHVTAEMPTAFDWVQLVYRSVEAGAIVITSAGVGANDGNTAYPGITGGLLTAVTFGGATKGTIPPRIASGIPSYLFSDWIPLTSLARADGGTFPLVIARTYFAAPDGSGAGTGYSYSVRLTGGELTGLSWKQGLSAVDGVSVPANYSQTALSGNGVLQGIRVMSRSTACTVSFVGDSVQAGQGSTGGLKSAGFLACNAVSTLASPVIYSGDSAYNGASPATYWQIWNNSVASVKPRIAFYSVSSINEAVTTQAIQDKHYAYAMRFVQDCFDNNVIPVLQTCVPQNRGSTANDLLRKGLNDRVKAMAAASAGVYICDVDAAVADPAAPYQYLPAYNSGDNSHMNDAGYSAASVPMTALLNQITGL